MLFQETRILEKVLPVGPDGVGRVVPRIRDLREEHLDLPARGVGSFFGVLLGWCPAHAFARLVNDGFPKRFRRSARDAFCCEVLAPGRPGALRPSVLSTR